MSNRISPLKAQRRRVALIVQLTKGPCSAKHLIGVLEQKQLFHDNKNRDSDISTKHHHYQFHKDLKALRLQGCRITFDRKKKYYTLSISAPTQATSTANQHKTPPSSRRTQLQRNGLRLLTAFLKFYSLYKNYIPDDIDKH